MFSIAIITAPRENKINYLPISIRSLRIAGFFENIYICAEPFSPAEKFEDGRFIFHHQKLGCADNWLFALNFLLKNTQEDWIIIAEDDFACKRNSRAKIETFIKTLDRPIGYISGFTSEVYFLKNLYTGPKKEWIEYNPGMNAFGNQFYVMPRSSAQMLLDESKSYFKEFPQYSKDKKGVDFIVSTFFEKKNLPCYYPIPSLFDHLAFTNFRGYLY